MSEHSQGEGWWQASDGKWYPHNIEPGKVALNPELPPPPDSSLDENSLLRSLFSPRNFIQRNYVNPSGLVGGASYVDAVLGTVLVLVGVGIPLLMAGIFHTYSVPQNDDWAFRLIAQHFFKTGNFVYNDWEAMILYGQVFWTWLFDLVFGFQQWIFAVSVATLSSLGLLSAFAICRRMLTRGWSFFLVFLMTTYVGFSYNVGNYMTDLPAFSLALVCIYFGVKCSEKAGLISWMFLGISMFTGIWAFSVRQFAIAAPLAVLIALYSTNRSKRTLFLFIGAALIVLCFVLLQWANHTTGFVHAHLQVPTGAELIQELRMFETLSFMMSPAIAIATWRIWPHRWNNAVSFGALFGFAIGVDLLFEGSNFFAGDYFWQGGITSWLTLTGAWPNLYPNFMWDGFIAIAIVSSACLVGIFIHSLRFRNHVKYESHTNTQLLISLYFVGSLVLVFLSGMIGEAQFDRFLWPVAFAGSLLLLMIKPVQTQNGIRQFNKIKMYVGALTTVLMVSSLALTANTLSLNSAAWTEGHRLVSQGYKANEIDAGFAWVGSQAGYIYAPVYGSRGGFISYDKQFLGPKFKYIISTSWLSIPTLKLAGTSTYKEFGLISQKNLYIYKVENK